MSDDPILDRLVRIRREFQRILIDEGYLPELPEEECEQAKQSGFTTKEAKAWLKIEPDFGKRITKPLRNRRKRHFMVAMLLLALSIPHGSFQISVPNETPHPHLPNVDDALPYVR